MSYDKLQMAHHLKLSKQRDGKGHYLILEKGKEHNLKNIDQLGQVKLYFDLRLPPNHSNKPQHTSSAGLRCERTAPFNNSFKKHLTFEVNFFINSKLLKMFWSFILQIFFQMSTYLQLDIGFDNGEKKRLELQMHIQFLVHSIASYTKLIIGPTLTPRFPRLI